MKPEKTSGTVFWNQRRHLQGFLLVLEEEQARLLQTRCAAESAGAAPQQPQPRTGRAASGGRSARRLQRRGGSPWLSTPSSPSESAPLGTLRRTFHFLEKTCSGGASPRPHPAGGSAPKSSRRRGVEGRQHLRRGEQVVHGRGGGGQVKPHHLKPSHWGGTSHMTDGAQDQMEHGCLVAHTRCQFRD